MQNQTKFDIETGTKLKLNKNENTTSKKCSKLIVNVTLTFMVMAVFIGYFLAISRNSNIIGSFQEFDIANVTKSPIFGNYYSSNTYSFKVHLGLVIGCQVYF